MRLSDLSYYKTGGVCEALHFPKTAQELVKIVCGLRREQRPYFLLGGGTNSLIMDEPFAGHVISFRDMQQLSRKGVYLTVGAGVENTKLANFALQEQLSGISWMNRLPGQLGGTVRMNARCYGGEMSQVTQKVTVVTKDAEVVTYEGKHVFRGYKDTILMDQGDLVVEAELVLKPGDPHSIASHMQFCENDRKNKGQFDFPSCGCVFKNDYALGISSGMLLDHAGAKSLKVGGAEVSPYHANFVFNKGASARDILLLSFAMRDLVYAHFGAWMEYEMEILGTMPLDLKSRFEEKRSANWNEEKLAPLRKKMP